MMHRKFTMVLAVFFALLTFSACGKAASDASEPSSDASSSVSSGVSAETSSETGSEEPSSEVSSEEASSEESSEESSAETSSAESSAASTSSKPASSTASSKPSSTASSKPSSTASSKPSSKPSESSSASSAESSSEPSSKPSSESSSASSAPSASSSVSASDIYSAIDAAFRSKYGDGPIVNSPYSVDDTSLTELFHLNSDQVESYCGMMAGMMTNCDELLVVQAKDGKVNEVKAALEQRLSEQKDSFAHYPVMFNDVRLDDAKVVVKGNYVALLIVGVITDEINEAGEADFTGDVEMAENAFYSAID